MKKAGKIWESSIKQSEDIQRHLTEINQIIDFFEGCKGDLEDFNLMQKALLQFQKDHQQLSEPNLSWNDFNSQSNNLLQYSKALFENEELPWPVDDVYICLKKEIFNIREQKSQSWINSINNQAKNLSTMTLMETKKLKTFITNIPATLAQEDIDHVYQIIERIDERLNEFDIEELVNLFKSLSHESKRKFLDIASGLIDY
jgi:DNA repair ATPase RecN